jgi:hypothetical protein
MPQNGALATVLPSMQERIWSLGLVSPKVVVDLELVHCLINCKHVKRLFSLDTCRH